MPKSKKVRPTRSTPVPQPQLPLLPILTLIALFFLGFFIYRSVVSTPDINFTSTQQADGIAAIQARRDARNCVTPPPCLNDSTPCEVVEPENGFCAPSPVGSPVVTNPQKCFLQCFGRHGFKRDEINACRRACQATTPTTSN